MTTATAEKFFAKNDYGLVDMLRPLTREDFGPAGEVRTESTANSKYGSPHVSVWQVFELVTEIDEKDISTFRGLIQGFGRRQGEKIVLQMYKNKNVALQGVRKEKQEAKLLAAINDILATFDGEEMLANKIEEINKETLETLSKDRGHNVQQAVLHLRNPSSYKWEENKNIQLYRNDLKELNRRKKELNDQIDAIQKEEIKKYIEENVPEPIKTAALKELAEKGLHDDSPFGRHF